MAESFVGRKRIRKTFGKLSEIVEIPNLIEVQKKSYDAFLQKDVKPEDREPRGLQSVFLSIFPIVDYSGQSQLEFIRYEFEEPKYDVDECSQRGLTYSAALKVVFRLVVWDVDEDTGARSIRDIKEQEVYMSDIPLMTDHGTFVVNGTERVIVSQMHRSPGVFFDHDRGKTHYSGKYLFSARVIPYRGSWLDFEFDGKDVPYVRIDRRRKLPVTTLLLCLAEDLSPLEEKLPQDEVDKIGMSSREIFDYFYDTVEYKKTKDQWKTAFVEERYKGVKLLNDLVDAKTGEVVAKAETKITPRKAKLLIDDGLSEILISNESLIGSYLAKEVVDEESGEIIADVGDEITEEIFEKIGELNLKTISILDIDHINVGPYIRNAYVQDKNRTRSEALIDIYRIMRPGEPPTVEGAESLFRSLLF